MKAKFSKFSVFLFLLYFSWYGQAKGTVSLFLYGGTALVGITTLIYMNGKSIRILIPPAGFLWGVGYGIYSLITGIVVAPDRSLMLSSLVTYFAFLFVCYCIAIICRGEEDVDWLRKILVAVCIVCAIYTLFWGYDYYNGIYVITMGPGNNPNTLGAQMVFGMFAALYHKEQKNGKLLFTLVLVVLFTYIIVLTGSRKSLISALAMGLLWFVSFVRDTRKNWKRAEQIEKFLLAAIILSVVFIYFKNSYQETASFERMLYLFEKDSPNARWGMYVEAGELFKKSMLFGNGYKQFLVLSAYKSYSHSTYAEVLACGGIFGCLIYFTPIVQTGWLICKKLKREKSYQAGMLFALFVVEVFLGAVNIFMYSLMHMVMWLIMYILTEDEKGYLLKDYARSTGNV